MTAEAPHALGRVRRLLVRVLATLALLTMSVFPVAMLTEMVRSGERPPPVDPGSQEAAYGAQHPGEGVHMIGAVALLALGASGALGLLVRPGRAGAATQTVIVGAAMGASALITGNPDNHGGQAGVVDPAMLVLAVPPIAAGLSAAPWRTWTGRVVARPRLLAVAVLGLPALVPGVTAGLLQRNTWPPMADPHHQGHWLVMATLAFATVGVTAGAALPGRGWRVAAGLTALTAAGVGAASLAAPTAGSALPTAGAVGALVWAGALIYALSRSWRSTYGRMPPWR